MKKIVVILAAVVCSNALAWGIGHRVHAGLVMKFLPQEIRSFWSEQDCNDICSNYCFYPDNAAGEPITLTNKIGRCGGAAAVDYVLRMGYKDAYNFHKPVPTFYLLVKAFREGNRKAAALYAGAFMHGYADPMAFNHAPLIHYYTYCDYKHVKFPIPMDHLDLHWAEKDNQLMSRILQRLNECKFSAPGQTLKEAMLDLENIKHEDARFMCAREHKIIRSDDSAVEAMCDIAVRQTQCAVNRIMQAWEFSKHPVEDIAPEYFKGNGELAKEAQKILASAIPHDAAEDGVYDGLFNNEPPSGSIGIICEESAHMNSAKLGFGSRFLSACCARSLKRIGMNVKMIQFSKIESINFNPSDYKAIVIVTLTDFLRNAKVEQNKLKDYVKAGGKLVIVGGKSDCALSGMSSYMRNIPDNQLPVAKTYGIANEDVYRDMKVIRMSDKKEFSLKANPNTRAGWNKPYSSYAFDISKAESSSQPAARDKPVSVVELDNGKERFPVAIKNTNVSLVPAYLLMPFLFSDENRFADVSYPELDSFGVSILNDVLSL